MSTPIRHPLRLLRARRERPRRRADEKDDDFAPFSFNGHLHRSSPSRIAL
jgi:hypothetical protein